MLARVVTSGGLEVDVSPAGPADHAELFGMWLEAVEEGGAFPRRPPTTDAEFRGAWMQGMTAVVAARVDGRIAGSYFLRPAYPGLAAHVANAGYLVASEFRGRGVATALAEHSFEEAKRNGFDAMLFQLVLESNPSRRLWERLGFEQVGRVPDVVEGQAALLFWREL
jgi:L-amino acid N-acyltransferase YncA